METRENLRPKTTRHSFWRCATLQGAVSRSVAARRRLSARTAVQVTAVQEALSLRLFVFSEGFFNASTLAADKVFFSPPWMNSVTSLVMLLCLIKHQGVAAPVLTI